MEDNTELSKKKAFLVPIIILLVLGAVLFVPAGSLRFWEAWIYWSGFSALTLFITIYFVKKSPELLARRMQFKEKETTRKPPSILNLCFLCYIIPGLDFRFQWSTVPVWLVIIANALVFLGYIFIILVFKENRLCFHCYPSRERTKGYNHRSLYHSPSSNVPGTYINDIVYSSGTWFLLGHNPCSLCYR